MSTQTTTLAYDTQLRIRGYSRKVSIFQAVSDRDAGKILRSLCEGKPVDHLRQAAHFETQARIHAARYAAALRKAFMDKYGRPETLLDYKVCCIWDDSFPNDAKAILRTEMREENRCADIARAHRAAHKLVTRNHRPRTLHS